MKSATPAELARGTILVLSPHMDDEILGCGGTLAGIPDRSRVHVVYVTSGAGSANYDLPGVQADPDIDMAAVRKGESLAALREIGVPEANARFLNIPDFKVRANAAAIEPVLEELVQDLRPDMVLVPFRFDRHTDHVALNGIARRALANAGSAARVLEYFVYHQWKLLPSGDIRKHCRADHMVKVDIAPFAGKKRAALQCFATQTTKFFHWQTKPVLSEELVDEFSRGPELFLDAGDVKQDADLFDLPLWRVRLVHLIEPALKRRKEQIAFLFRRR